MIKTMLFCSAFSSVIPIGPFITLIGFWIQYWAEKVNIQLSVFQKRNIFEYKI